MEHEQALSAKACGGVENPIIELSNGVDYLCDSQTCGMAVRLVLGESAAEYEQWLECQHCKRCFGFPRIDWAPEPGLRQGATAALRRERLFEVVQAARNGDEEATNALCEILANELKRWIERTLNVRWQDRAAAHQEVILRVRERIGQLREPEKFLGWLRRVAVDAAKRHSALYLRLPRPVQEKQPKQIGTKTILVDGQAHVVKVFEASSPKPPRQPLLEPLSDLIIMNWSKENRTNHTRSIDFRSALKKLPKRWLLAVVLVFEEGYSRIEAAEIMGCSKNRIYRLHKKARKRLQLLLPGYTLGRKGKSQSPPREDEPANGSLVEKLAARREPVTSGNPADDGVDPQSREMILMESMCRHSPGSHSAASGGEMVPWVPDVDVDSNNLTEGR